MMKKWILAALMPALLLCLAPCAMADLPDETPPQEVTAHLNSRWSNYTLEDYVTLEGEQDYGFALVALGGRRELIGYRESGGAMKYYLRSISAVPQGRGMAWMNRDYADGGPFEDGGAAAVGGGDQAFAVCLLDEKGGDATVCYRIKDGEFHMTMYQWLGSGDEGGCLMTKEDSITYYTYAKGEKLGTAYGTVQTDLRYADLPNLPRTLREARSKLSSAPYLPEGAFFKPQEIKFTGGRTYPVYTGPGEETMRSGNGKGSVSTNDWIQVFGRLDDWIMIQYDISSDRFRIGWIEASALPRGAKVDEFDRGFEYYALEDMLDNLVLVECSLTDDPFNSRTEIARLSVGTKITEIVYDYEGWSYIRTVIGGQEVFGFVPSDCIDHG